MVYVVLSVVFLSVVSALFLKGFRRQSHSRPVPVNLIAAELAAYFGTYRPEEYMETHNGDPCLAAQYLRGLLLPYVEGETPNVRSLYKRIQATEKEGAFLPELKQGSESYEYVAQWIGMACKEITNSPVYQ